MPYADSTYPRPRPTDTMQSCHQAADSHGSEPVAWAVVLNAIEAISMNGGATYRVTASKDEVDRIAANAMVVVPLYERPHPALTEGERKAVQEVIDYLQPPSQKHQNYVASTLRGLLERLG